jgi:cytoskeletal protein RodZ
MLPDSTLAKTFLRTYSEYLGLDAQLLIEEYRALHEPRGEGDLPAFTPRTAREPRQRRAGPPIGPGGAFAIGIVMLLVLFAVLGLTGGEEDDTSDEPATTQSSDDERAEARKREARERRERRERAANRRLVLRVVPTGPTYVCVDDAKGQVTFEGTIAEARSFRARRGGRLRINLGRAAVRLTANGRRVRIEDGPAGAGFSFTRAGRATPLPAEQRPCA